MSARTFLATTLLLAGAGAVSACGGSIGGSPSTTEKPMTAQEMCVNGHNVFSRISELDRTKPDFLPKLKETIRVFGTQAPAEIYDDLKAWTDYVKSVTDASQLENLPADLQVSTKRVDAWWQRNCGKSFTSA
jgi:hypothetical protein